MACSRSPAVLLLMGCLILASAANAGTENPGAPGEGVEEEEGAAQASDAEPSEPQPGSTSEGGLPGAADIEHALRTTPTQGIEEITITGTTVLEEATDAPTSNTTFSAEELAAVRAYDLRDLSAYTPNLEIQTSFASSNPTLFIRGVGLDDVNANSAAAVAVYYNDIYMNSPSGVLTQLFDVASVEVLRGPQTGVYGRNASAGAIVVRHREPTDELNADLSASFGNLDLREVNGALGAPIFPGLLASRVAFKYYDRAGFVTNRCGIDPLDCGASFRNPVPEGLPTKVNARNNWAGRGMLRLTPPDVEMNWLLNVHGSQNDDDATQFQHVAARSPIKPTPDGGRRICQPDLGDDCLDRSFYADQDGDPFAGDYNAVGKEKLDTWGTSLTGDWALGDWTLSSVTGYEWNDRVTDENTDANPNLLLGTTYRNSARQVSQELRADWSDGAEWKVLAGGYFLGEDLDVHNTFVNGAGPRLNDIDQKYTQKTLALAAYGQVSWNILDDFIIDAGLRLNWEEKDFDIQAIVTRHDNPGGPELTNISDREKQSWWAPTGLFSLTYHPTDDLSFYGKYTRGWKPGHFNGGALFPDQIIEPVDPETVDAFEVGMGSSWWDQRVSLDLAGFYYDYADLQVFNIQNSEGGLPLLQLINANDAVVYGAELDFGIRPLEGFVTFDELTFALNFGWLETEYKDFTTTVRQNLGRGVGNVLVPVIYTGNPLIGAPRFSVAGSVEWPLPLGGLDSPRWGTLIPRYDFTWKDDTFFDPSGGRGVFGEYENIFVLGQEAYWLHNLRLTYRSPDGRWEVAGWVRNLTDQAYKTDAFDVTLGFGYIGQAVGEPRTYGVTLSLSF